MTKLLNHFLQSAKSKKMFESILIANDWWEASSKFKSFKSRKIFSMNYTIRTSIKIVHVDLISGLRLLALVFQPKGWANERDSYYESSFVIPYDERRWAALYTRTLTASLHEQPWIQTTRLFRTSFETARRMSLIRHWYHLRKWGETKCLQWESRRQLHFRTSLLLSFRVVISKLAAQRTNIW